MTTILQFLNSDLLPGGSVDRGLKKFLSRKRNLNKSPASAMGGFSDTYQCDSEEHGLVHDGYHPA